MNLGAVLSKEPTNDYIPVNDFASKRPVSKGASQKIDVGQVHLHLKCNKCDDITFFSSANDLYFVAIDKDRISIDCQLTCEACQEVTIPYWFLIGVEDVQEKPKSFSYPKNPKVRLIYKQAKWDSKVEPQPFEYNKEYSDLLIKADLAYQNELGAGALVYLRRLYEKVLHDVANTYGISINGRDGKELKFGPLLTRIRTTYDIIPAEFQNDGYELFSELSNIVHYNEDEKWGIIKYDSLRRLIIGILDKIKNETEIRAALKNIDNINSKRNSQN